MMHGFGGSPLETKFRRFDGELALKDGAEIAGYASLFGAADQGGDVVVAGAYGASLARLASAGRGVKMLWQHDPARPIGVWDEVRRELGPDVRTIAYDLPGHGGSLALREAVSAKRAAAAILADMAERAPGPFHLVGHSMGGAVAALMAMSQPERIVSLTLLAPGGFGDTISEPLLARFATARTRDELAAALAPMGHPQHRSEAGLLYALARIREAPEQTALLVELAATISRGGSSQSGAKRGIGPSGGPNVRLRWSPSAMRWRSATAGAARSRQWGMLTIALVAEMRPASASARMPSETPAVSA